MRVFFLLLSHGTLQQYVAGFPKVCGEHEAVVSAKEYEEKPHCWIPSTDNHIGECNCGEAYVQDQYGRCTSCSEGFERNEVNKCVRCPRMNERWCSGLNKCICSKDFRRNKAKICIPCGDHKESDGHSGCKRISTEYSTKTAILGMMSVSTLGLTCGYLIRKYKLKYCARN